MRVFANVHPATTFPVAAAWAIPVTVTVTVAVAAIAVLMGITTACGRSRRFNQRGTGPTSTKAPAKTSAARQACAGPARYSVMTTFESVRRLSGLTSPGVASTAGELASLQNDTRWALVSRRPYGFDLARAIYWICSRSHVRQGPVATGPVSAAGPSGSRTLVLKKGAGQ